MDKKQCTTRTIILWFMLSFASWGAEYSVCKSGCDCNTITDAVNMASENDSIVISDSGIYKETISISDPNLTIRVSEPNQPVVEGSFVLSADDITIEGLTIKPGSELSFVTILSNAENVTTGCKIANCDIGGSQESLFPVRVGIGVFARHANSVILDNNTFHDLATGVLIRGNDNQISNNTISNSIVGVWSVGNGYTLSSNEIKETGCAVQCIGSDGLFDDNSIHDNQGGLWISGNRIEIKRSVIYSNSDNNSSDNSKSGGIIWQDCEELNIHNNTIRNNENGIVGYYGIGDNTWGTHEYDAAHNKARWNNLYENTDYDIYYDPNDPDYEGEDEQQIFNARHNYWGEDQSPDVSAYVDASDGATSPNSIEGSYTIPDTLPLICGDLPLPADLNGPEGVPDCKVDLYDLTIFAESWMFSTAPDWLSGS